MVFYDSSILSPLISHLSTKSQEGAELEEDYGEAEGVDHAYGDVANGWIAHRDFSTD